MCVCGSASLCLLLVLGLAELASDQAGACNAGWELFLDPYSRRMEWHALLGGKATRVARLAIPRARIAGPCGTMP